MFYIFILRSRRVLKINEIIDTLEDLDAEEDIQGIDVYMDPPADGIESDGDSGEEDCDDVNRLNRNQLLAPAEIVMLQREECDDDDTTINEVSVTTSSPAPTPEIPTRPRKSRKRRHDEESSSTAPPATARSDDDSGSQSTRRGGQQNVRPRKWVKRDLRPQQVDWSSPPPRVVLTINKDSEPIEFFELFFNEDVIRHIVRHSVMYAVEKHNTSFSLSGDEMFCFLGILILSGYAPLPRRRMYWESNEDTHNVLVAKSMRSKRFEEIFRYFHVADNSNLRSGDKMAKNKQNSV